MPKFSPIPLHFPVYGQNNETPPFILVILTLLPFSHSPIIVIVNKGER